VTGACATGTSGGGAATTGIGSGATAGTGTAAETACTSTSTGTTTSPVGPLRVKLPRCDPALPVSTDTATPSVVSASLIQLSDA
jgi:hypothetical protein